MTPSPQEFPEFLNGDFLTPWENIYTSATDDEWKFLGAGGGGGERGEIFFFLFSWGGGGGGG